MTEKNPCSAFERLSHNIGRLYVEVTSFGQKTLEPLSCSAKPEALKSADHLATPNAELRTRGVIYNLSSPDQCVPQAVSMVSLMAVEAGQSGGKNFTCEIPASGKVLDTFRVEKSCDTQGACSKPVVSRTPAAAASAPK